MSSGTASSESDLAATNTDSPAKPPDVNAAAAAFQATLKANPDDVPALLGLAKLQIRAGRGAAARPGLQRARTLAPENADVLQQLALCDLADGNDAAAETLARAAVALDGNAPSRERLALLAETLQRQFRNREALDVREQLVAVDPENHALESSLLFQRNYFEWPDPTAEFVRARQWDERHTRRLRPATRTYANDRDPHRRLRVGYVSPDFRWHAVAHFAQPVLTAHDRTAVEIFCYANHTQGDLNSRRFEALADHWIKVNELSDEALAERIRADGIDVLVDLAGHSAHHRLMVFARQPAPVQATWLGYCHSTGLTAIDYRIVDEVVEPSGWAEGLSAETVVRLPHGFHCFAPPAENPPVRPSPASLGAPVTFGSFNNAQKHTPEVIALWSEVLKAVPGSRLLLKSSAYNGTATRLWFLRRFAENGIEAGRVRLTSSTSSAAEHWSTFGLIDVALDPFPYNGTTTTCDAFWMGVPLVTLEGRSHRARVGMSLLQQIGRPEWIAANPEEYVTLARNLAEEAWTGRFDRAALREAMRASSLCDARGLAGRLESAYRTMWRTWLGAPVVA